MTLLGLDFDNTLVRYDTLFHQLALEKGLIKDSLPVDKTAIRDYLRSQGQDEQFTLLQGEVYGLRILEAEPAEGMMEALMYLNRKEVPMVLVSHKTKTPYKGPKYKLREAALAWLRKNGFMDQNGLNWKDNIFFESTKQLKIEKVISTGCTHYIDDLPEILNMLPRNIEKILFDPNNKEVDTKNHIKIRSWSELLQHF